jgi:Protein of unknown function (DUF1360)
MPADPTEGHSAQHRPLAAYGALTVAFNGLFAAALLAARRADRLPDRFGAGDALLLGAATAQLSRLLSKDRVTSVLRAPFTRFEEDTGYGEVSEAARGTGFQRAIGELMICQFCVAQWVAAGMALGHAVAPRETRVVAGTFTVYGISNVLNLAYSAAQDRA